MKKLFFYCFILTLYTQCKNDAKTFQIDKAYIESLEKERKDRDNRRVKYLELCGLFKLDTTGTIFGIDKSNKVSTSHNDINQNILACLSEHIPNRIQKVIFDTDSNSNM